jgi:hypothetical protein
LHQRDRRPAPRRQDLARTFWQCTSGRAAKILSGSAAFVSAPDVAAGRVVIGLKVGKCRFQITGIPEQHMVETFSPDRPDQALHKWV